MTKTEGPSNYRTLKFVINDYQGQLTALTRRAHNLYNKALYQIRQALFNNRNWLSYQTLNTYFKEQAKNHANDLYRQMLYTQSAQQTLREVTGIWSAWHKALKAYYKNPSKFTGKPNIPKYLPKNHLHIYFITNQNARIKNGYLSIKKLPWLKIKLSKDFQNFKRIAIRPLNHHKFMLLIQYEIDSLPDAKPDNGKYLGIDPGIDNAFTCATNQKGVRPLLINGKLAKSINQFYNKKRAYYSQLHARYQQCSRLINTKNGPLTVYYDSRKQQELTNKRNSQILAFAHKASKRIIEYALSCDANTIVIGKNNYWKRSSKMGKRNNQNFIGLPHAQMIDLIKYKAQQVGITVICHNESYTSQTSFLDNEKPCWDNGNKARDKQIRALKQKGYTHQQLKEKGLGIVNRRLKRGLFQSNQGYLINADVNAALQIIKKVFSKVKADEIGDNVFYPVKWTPQNLVHLANV